MLLIREETPSGTENRSERHRRGSPRPPVSCLARRRFRAAPIVVNRPVNQGLHPPSILFQRDLPWRDARRTHPAAPIRAWLFESGSLTARLRALTGNRFGVRLLTQDRRRPFPSECALLDLPEHRLALVREVALHSEGLALVLARTIVPHQALRGAYHGLAHLGERPLGELLFANPRLKRSRLELARVGCAGWSSEAARAYGIATPVWGRRSLYEIDEASILVCEFFLPALLNFPESDE